MTCEACVISVDVSCAHTCCTKTKPELISAPQRALKDLPGVLGFASSLENQIVIVDSTLPTDQLQLALEGLFNCLCACIFCFTDELPDSHWTASCRAGKRSHRDTAGTGGKRNSLGTPWCCGGHHAPWWRHADGVWRCALHPGERENPSGTLIAHTTFHPTGVD